MTADGQRRLPRPALLLACLVLQASFAWAQDISRELNAAAAVLRECAGHIEKRCYFPLTAPAVATRVMAEMNKAGGPDAPPAPDLRQMSESEALQAARAHVEKLCVLPGQRLGPVELVEQALAAYCHTIDPWTHYETSEDAARIEKARAIKGSGVGMTLREKDGAFYCYPFPESVASLAGIRPGDRLVSVDGREVKGASPNLLATWIKGAPGSQVMLRIEKSTGRAQLLPLLREAGSAAPAFRVERDAGGVVLRVRRFDADVVTQITAALAEQPTTRLLTLDLRGNQGGSLKAAVELAQLFLDQDAKIATVVERGAAPLEFKAEVPAALRPSQVSILQDEGTASAAEIAIAALVDNLPGRAASQGGKTYGKGVVQDEIRLQGGGTLILTTGIIFGPTGLTWNEKGLLPSTTSKGKIYPDGALSITSPATRPKPVVKLVD
jgi:carboxyl-terminal processing protease